MSRPHPALIVLLALLITGCGGGDTVTYEETPACTPNLEFGVVVYVRDATTGAAVVNATATLVEGAYTEQLTGSPIGVYTGAQERVGIYQLEVAAANYQTTYRSDLVVAADVCHVIPVIVEIALQPK